VTYSIDQKARDKFSRLETLPLSTQQDHLSKKSLSKDKINLSGMMEYLDEALEKKKANKQI
jgi:hypothetical protein